MLLNDISGRYYLDKCVFNISDRNELNTQVAMFESWRSLISEELLSHQLTKECYTPLSVEELKQLSLYEILELRDIYTHYNKPDEP